MPCTEACSSADSEWVCCEKCNEWYHFSCCGIDRSKVPELVEFHCVDCVPEHGPSIEALKSKRRRIKYNYAKLDDGIIEVSGTHLHAARFAEPWGPHPFPIVDGHTLPSSLDTPVIIKSKDYDTLGMSIPKGIDSEYVSQLLGPEMPLPVVDVATQDILSGWTLGKWVEFLKSDHKNTYNVISLEFSRTPLKQEIVRPQYVRDNDLVDKVWPEKVPGKPEVGYYCLMGVAGSYTDFHVDFGGTSVYYHIVEGAKTFLFVPPTPANMRAYEKWCKNPDQSTTWFPDTLRNSECWRVDLEAGDTMLLPSGWLHAVYTPADSFVIGGNFLSVEFLGSHLKVNSLEQRIMTPKKFTFPNFHKTLQFVRQSIDKGEIEVDQTVLETLDKYLKSAEAEAGAEAKAGKQVGSNTSSKDSISSQKGLGSSSGAKTADLHPHDPPVPETHIPESSTEPEPLLRVQQALDSM